MDILPRGWFCKALGDSSSSGKGRWLSASPESQCQQNCQLTSDEKQKLRQSATAISSKGGGRCVRTNLPRFYHPLWRWSPSLEQQNYDDGMLWSGHHWASNLVCNKHFEPYKIQSWASKFNTLFFLKSSQFNLWTWLQLVFVEGG